MGKSITLDSKVRNKKELRIVQQGGHIYGMIDGKIFLQGDDQTEVWKLLCNEADKDNAKYFGFDGARNRFLHWFKGGFSSPALVKAERNYKWDAKVRLDAAAPLEKALTGSGYGPAILTVFQRTNLLSLFELVRMREVLQGPSADVFVRASARFTMGEMEDGLFEMQRALKPHELAKWTAVTYLPFLWRPDAHMFLKPEATKDFAQRVGHHFFHDYEPRLHLAVYESLLDLVVETEAEMGDLHPKDRIDVQSFIWVVGDYQDGRETPQP
jgi:hypothetical protein